MGFQLDNIKTKNTIQAKKEAVDYTSFLRKEITLFNKPFTNKVKEEFYTELSVLLKAGITLKQSLELIQNSQKKKQNEEVLSNISADIISGQTLSQTLRSKRTFTDYEYYSVKIGEETGTLAQVCEQLGSFFTRKNEQRRNIISALTYPIIILSTAVLVVIFMLSYVVPMFEDIFEQQNVELPGITKFIIASSDFMKHYGWIIILAIISMFFAKTFFSKKEWFREAKDNLVLKIPFIGNFAKTVYLSQFTQAVSLLTASKVPVVNSIQLVKQMIKFYPLQNALENVETNILKGNSLSQSLAEQKLFDEKMVALVKVAEETNQNEFIFNRLNSQYSAQVQQQSKMFSTLMEPIIIMIVGLIVGVILIAMYLPMFKLSSVLG